MDVYFDGNSLEVIPGPRIQTGNTHGTGCTTASAIASYLAKGHDMLSAVKLARKYVTDALDASKHLNLGDGPQKPFNHM